jgi:CRP/FNR family cyclic AMP-dependent transcriptional regulator
MKGSAVPVYIACVGAGKGGRFPADIPDYMNGDTAMGTVVATEVSKEAQVKQVLLNSTLTEELRDAEIDVLARIMELREYKAGAVIEQSGENNYAGALRDSLMMLGSGRVEVNYSARGQTVNVEMKEPGELGIILGFIGGDVSQVSVGMVAKTDCTLLVLDRRRFESLLNGNPAVVYYVMRGITRYVHGIVRRLNRQTVEMTNYLYFARHTPHAAV